MDNNEKNPPTTNRGVTTLIRKEIIFSIDWLTFTLPFGYSVDFVMEIFGFKIKNPHAKPRRGYNAAITFDKGRMDWHSERQHEMGLGIVITGEEMELFRLEMTDTELVEMVADMRGRFSRLDLCLDVIGNENATMLSIQNIIMSGKYETSTKTKPHRNDDMTFDSEKTRGYTIYLGHRSSERMLRIYNKAAESGKDIYHVRIEAELKGDTAKRISKILSERGIKQVATAMFLKLFNPHELKWYHDAMATEFVDLPKGKRKETKTMKWFKKQVLPKFLQELEEGNDELAQLFALGLIDFYQKQKKEGIYSTLDYENLLSTLVLRAKHG